MSYLEAFKEVYMWKRKRFFWAALSGLMVLSLFYFVIWNAEKSPIMDDSTAEQVRAYYAKMKSMGIAKEHLNIFLRAFKQEQELEVWVSDTQQKEFQLLLTYPICKNSGDLGPKRKEGDLQVPEGLYHIDRMNPNSAYHLSMGLNYPNASDRIRGDQNEPGSDIFIHGGCVTVGCLPITDAKIEELYELVTQAQSNGQDRVPVHIFPARMDDPDFQAGLQDLPHSSFWSELLPLYQYFEQQRQVPNFTIDETGAYHL